MGLPVQKFPGGEHSSKEIFQNADRAGYLQTFIDFLRREELSVEKTLRIFLRKTLILTPEELAIIHKHQGRMTGFSMAIAKLEALASRPKGTTPEREPMPDADDE